MTMACNIIDPIIGYTSTGVSDKDSNLEEVKKNLRINVFLSVKQKLI